jgi:predicted ester cyclase
MQSGPVGEAPRERDDKAVIGVELVTRWVEELFNKRDLTVADSLIAETYIEHAIEPFGTTEPGPIDGPEGMRRTVGWLVDQFPDMHMTIEELISEGDLVAVRTMTTGTNLGMLNGVIPPTGNKFSARQTHWFRVMGGRLAEHWATREDLPAMIQLGVIRAPGPPTPPSSPQA